MTASVFAIVDRHASKEQICPTKTLEHLILKTETLMRSLFSKLFQQGMRFIEALLVEVLYMTTHVHMQVPHAADAR